MAGKIPYHIFLCAWFTLNFTSSNTENKKYHVSTDKGVSSRGSRVRTRFYGYIIDSRSDRVLTMYNLTIIYTEHFLFKKLAYLCVYAVT